MSLAETIRNRIDLYRIAYRASYERTLGKEVWAKIEERRLCFPSEYNHALNALLERSLEVEPSAWYQYVGEVAKDCPRSLPKHLRLRWVVQRLAGGLDRDRVIEHLEEEAPVC